MASNFEDLFDFSPQGDQPDFEDIDSYVEKNSTSLFRGEPRVLHPSRPFLEVSSIKLSASLPNSALSASYTGSSSPGSSSGGFVTRVSNSTEDSSKLLHLGKLQANYTGSPGEVQTVEQKSKRGRKPGQRSISFSSSNSFKSDMKNKLERSRQSARECRARKKLRYQYLDDLILEREKANTVLRDELLKYQVWCHKLDKGEVPEGLEEAILNLKKAGVGPVS